MLLARACAAAPSPPAREVAVVGAGGRVGGALAAAARRAGARVVEVDTRGGGDGGVPTERGTPVFVATHADALGAALDGLPAERLDDLVLLQNGILRPWLRNRGLAPDEVSQVVLRLAADGSVLSPAAGCQSVAFGTHAACAAALLPSCRVADSEAELQREALFKLLWAAAVPLACDAAGPGADVRTTFAAHEAELRELVAEMVAVAAPDALGVDADERLAAAAWADVCAYSRSPSIAAARPSAQLARAEWAWRNGWLLARGGGARVQPLHSEWVARAPSLRDLGPGDGPAPP